MIRTEIEDRGVGVALERLARTTDKLPTVLDLIGEMLVDSTKRRFSTSTGPDGERWAANSQVTILRYFGRYKSSYSKKTGKITAQGAERAGGKKPLMGESGSLASEIHSRVDGRTLYIGSPMVYAAAHQFGMAKGYAGTNRRGSPLPWGDIPARPFLGLSAQDEKNILDTISDFLVSPSGR